MERRGRRSKQLVDDLKERRGYSKLKGEALDRTPWRTRFGRDCGAVLRQTILMMTWNIRGTSRVAETYPVMLQTDRECDLYRM